MAFCSNCGKELNSGSKFCSECGTLVQNSNSQRKAVYEGEIHKCPNCGEVLRSFISKCPSCGYEIRGSHSSESVRDFAIKLSQITSDEQKVALLQSFPIPNTKEDIFEFMILAATNVNINRQITNENMCPAMSKAWLVKFEQSYQKALLLFKEDSDFYQIQKIYNEGHKNIIKVKRRTTMKSVLEAVIRNIAVWVGIITIIAAVHVDKTGGNASMLELVGYIVLIASACTLAKRSASMIDFGIGALSGLATMGMSSLFRNGSVGELCGDIVLIIIAVNFFKSVGNNKNKK